MSPVSGNPRRYLKAGISNELCRERVEAARHHFQAWTSQNFTQFLGRRHGFHFLGQKKYPGYSPDVKS